MGGKIEESGAVLTAGAARPQGHHRGDHPVSKRTHSSHHEPLGLSEPGLP